MNRKIAWIAGMAMLVVIGGCASTVSDQAALSLDKGQGLVGIELVSGLGNVDYQVKISGGVFGKMLPMNNVAKGESVYLYKLPAGRYCLEGLFLTGSDHYIKPAGDEPCFAVTTGRLTYAGTVANSLQDYFSVDMDAFLRALMQTYPKVYAHYVKGEGSVTKPAM